MASTSDPLVKYLDQHIPGYAKIAVELDEENSIDVSELETIPHRVKTTQSTFVHAPNIDSLQAKMQRLEAQADDSCFDLQSLIDELGNI